MANILEVIMLICFGFSWPINFIKAYRAGTSKGTSLVFFWLIEIGYASGIASKILAGNVTYVILFYVLNMITVGANIVMYFINKKREKATMESSV